MSAPGSRIACLFVFERGDGDEHQVAARIADGLLHLVDVATGHRWTGPLTRTEKARLREQLAHAHKLAADNTVAVAARSTG